MNAKQKRALPSKTMTLVRDGRNLLLPLDSETSAFLGLVEGSTVEAEIVDGALVVCGASGSRIVFTKK